MEDPAKKLANLIRQSVQDIPIAPVPAPVPVPEPIKTEPEYQPSMIKALRTHSSFAVLQADTTKKGQSTLADKLQEKEI